MILHMALHGTASFIPKTISEASENSHNAEYYLDVEQEILH